MRALIIEDELPSARRLKRLLQNYDIEILDVLPSIKATINWFKQNKNPDVIFLDIQLSDGLCFEIFKRVKVRSTIIFTTAFSNYSIKAFNYNSISYLLKPVQKEHLKEAIIKAQKSYTKDANLKVLEALVKNYKLDVYKTKFTVKVGKKIKIINASDVVCFFSFNNATFLKTKSFNYTVNASLTHLETQIDPNYFFRVNRTFIVNINAIKDIIAYTNSRLKLVLTAFSDTDIIVSRDKVKAFKNWID